VINQVLFLFGLYGFGVYFGLIFKRQIPCAFIGVTGFLWGTLFWVVGGIFFKIVSIPYTPVSMIAFFIILAVVFSIIHIKMNTWQLSRSELTYLLLMAIAFILVLVIASIFNLSIGSTDSITNIFLGRRIAYEGLSEAFDYFLSTTGVYLPQLQSASIFLGDDYLYAAQPAFAYTFFLIYLYLSHQVIGNLFSDKRVALALTFLTGLVLFSTYYMVWQVFYIHNNMISAVYLFVAVSTFWLASIEDKYSWMIFALLGLMGFSLARTEAPIFALIFLVIVISFDQFSYRIRLISILPYLFILILWYLYLFRGMGEGTLILNPERTLVIISSLVSFGILVVLSELRWIKRFLLPILPKIMLGLLLLILVFMVFQKPEHMMDSLTAIIKNMIESGRWGITWIIISLLLVFSLAQPRVPKEELFFYGISSFFSLLLVISYFHGPFRLGWGDSANRMLTHILPIIILYVLMTTVKGLSRNGLFEKKAISNKIL